MNKETGRLVLILLSLIFAFTIGHQWHGDRQVSQETANDRVQKTQAIHCGYILYPPYIEKDLKTGQLQGVAYDLIEMLGQALHKKIEWTRELAVNAEIPELKKGGIDAVCAITGAFD